MPVTSKLSRKFYEKLGDANELVEWFNAVDATYRGDLRDLNERNFARFDAKLDQRLAEFDAKWERRMAESDTKWERRVTESDTKWEQRLAESDAKWEGRWAELRAEFREAKADLIKWTFVFVTGGTLTVLSVLIAVLKL